MQIVKKKGTSATLPLTKIFLLAISRLILMKFAGQLLNRGILQKLIEYHEGFARSLG